LKSLLWSARSATRARSSRACDGDSPSRILRYVMQTGDTSTDSMSTTQTHSPCASSTPFRCIISDDCQGDAMRSFIEMKRDHSTHQRTWARASVCLLILIASVGLDGCAGAYYGTGGYYGSGGYYGRGYVANPGYVSIAIEDRPYYTHGPGYWAGRRYYVWRGGHWRHRHGGRIWVPGHYVIR
jgi:hypothetical protein